MAKPLIRPYKIEDAEAVRVFADENIGTGYFSLEETKEMVGMSEKNGIPCSFVLEEDGQIQGIRLCFPPGQWIEKAGRNHVMPHLWKVPEDAVGYFKSLFISERYRGGGLGPQLSNTSMDSLRKLGAKAIITHSWKESPANTSVRYLQKMGFQVIGEHPLFWSELQYDCTKCLKPPCQCTAIEMIYYL